MLRRRFKDTMRYCRTPEGMKHSSTWRCSLTRCLKSEIKLTLCFTDKLITMNNTFNFKRFGLVFRKDFMENWRRYLLLFLTLVGLMAIVTIYQSWTTYELFNHIDVGDRLYIDLNEALLITLSVMFLAAGLWFASTFAAPMNSKLKNISYLTNPSSNLEKFLVRWIITTVGFILVFFAALWIADLLRVTVCTVRYPEVGIKFLDIRRLSAPTNDYVYSDFLMPRYIFIALLSLYFLLQSLFLLGAMFWGKGSFIKTFTAVVAIIGTFLIICYVTISVFYRTMEEFYNVVDSFDIGRVFTPEQFFSLLSVVLAIFTCTFWVLAYFRLKESEIIKRF